MRVEPTALPGVAVIEPNVFPDARGFFLEAYHAERYAEAGIRATFVQDNHSRSVRGTVRGLHAQLLRPQAKLVRVLQGEIFDVVVDVRRGSPTFKRWVGVTLSAENFRQIYVPTGFAHGFCVTSETALFTYKCSDVYAPEHEGGIAWNDPDIGIRWPIDRPNLSAKDQKYPRLKELDRSRLFEYRV